jgi:hypothetical protein
MDRDRSPRSRCRQGSGDRTQGAGGAVPTDRANGQLSSTHVGRPTWAVRAMQSPPSHRHPSQRHCHGHLLLSLSLAERCVAGVLSQAS